MKSSGSLPDNAKFHFIAIGGIGMSGLAKILLEAGYEVSGSDLAKNELTGYLESRGARIYTGHDGGNLGDCTAVIKSTAIKENNPELKKAAEKNIPVMHRAELLNKLMSGYKTSIGVTGTHGKTTTTGMITAIFHELGLEPGFAIGGEFPRLGTNAACGRGGHFIAEIDESDGTVELYSPDITVITNLEFEHPDHYKGGFSQLLETFERFISRAKGKIILNIDDEGNNKLIKNLGKNRFITCSTKKKEADYLINGGINLNLPGAHNMSNAAIAIAASVEAGIDFERASGALSKFTGMKKRFQTLGYASEGQIVDDYAHHPTEIRATVQTAKSLNKNRVIAVFQPHRYTRLASLWDDFLKCFDEADIVYVCDVYPAGEDPVTGVNSEEFHKNLRHGAARYIRGELDAVAEEVIKEIQANDIVLTMGAGSITKLGRIIMEKANGKNLK